MSDGPNRTHSRRQILKTVGVSGLVGFGGCSSTTDSTPTATTSTTTKPTSSRTATTTAPTDTLYVSSKHGSTHGDGSKDSPFETIQAALNQVQPGETIHVQPGVYAAEPGDEKPFVHTTRAGTPQQPITITGPPDAIVKGGLPGGFLIRHSHVHIRGLTFDGLRDPANPKDAASYAIGGINVIPLPLDEPTDYLEDIVVKPHAMGNLIGAAVNFRYTNHVEVGEFEVIGPVGVEHLYGYQDGHSGELVYIGTAWHYSEKTADRFDYSHDYHVHHIDNSAGHPHAELVDVKAPAHDVTIEYCTDGGGSGRYILERHADTSEAGVRLGGRTCTLRWSRIENGHGAGVEIGAQWLAEDEGPPELDDNGRNHAVYGNHLLHNDSPAIRFPRNTAEGDPFVPDEYDADDQRTICNNEYTPPTDATPDSSCPEDLPNGDGIGHTGGDSPF